MKDVNPKQYRVSVRRKLIDAAIQNREKPHTVTTSTGEEVILGLIGATYAIDGDSFYANPRYEDFYFREIQNDKTLWNFYNRWILLGINHDFSAEEKLKFVLYCSQKLKEHIPRKQQMVILWLFFDVFHDLISALIQRADLYYEKYIPEYLQRINCISAVLRKVLVAFPVEDFNSILQKIQTFATDLKKNLKVLGELKDEYDYKVGSIGVILQESFKRFYFEEIFQNNIFSISPILGERDDFKIAFEKKWQDLKLYQNSSYGFWVVPFINPADYFRYLEFTLVAVENVEKQAVAYQVLDFLTYDVFSKNPYNKPYYEYIINRLIIFIEKRYVKPFLKKVAKNLKPQRQVSDLEKDEEFLKPLAKIVNDYDPFFLLFEAKSSKRLKGFDDGLFAPIGKNGKLFLLGNLSEGRGFAFIAYIKAKIRTLVKEFIGLKEWKNKRKLSLDQSISSDQDDLTLEDILAFEKDLVSEDQEEDSNDYAYPPCDTQDNEWYIDKFAEIIEVAPKTLRRWDKEDSFTPHRRTRGKKGIRCYIESQIPEARRIKALKERRQKHQVI